MKIAFPQLINKTPRTLWKPKAPYCIYNNQLFVPILSQISPITPQLNILKVKFHIIFPPTFRAFR